VQVDVADATFAYSSRWGSLLGLIVLAAFTAGSAVLTAQAFESIGSVGARSVLFASLGGLGMLCVFAFGLGTVIAGRDLVAARPAFRLDGDGVEWSAGRLSWSSVDAVGLVTHVNGEGHKSRWFVLHLRPEQELLPKGADRYKRRLLGFGGDLVPERREGSVHIELWTGEQEARELIARLSGHPVLDSPPVTG
jgi:hypothetical protein